MTKFSREGSSSRKPAQGGKSFKKSGPSSTGKSFKSSGSASGSRFKRTDGESSGSSQRPYKSRPTGGFGGDSKPRFSKDNEGGDRPKRSFKPRPEGNDADSRPRFKRPDGESTGSSPRPYKSRPTGGFGGDSKPRFSKDNEGGDRPKRSFKPRPEGSDADSRPRFKRPDSESAGASPRPYKSRPTGGFGGDSKPRFSKDNEGGDRPKRSFKPRPEGSDADSRPRFKRPDGESTGASPKPYKSRSTGGFGGDSKPRFSKDNEGGDRPKRSFKPRPEGSDANSRPRFKRNVDGEENPKRDFKPKPASQPKEPKQEREGIRLNRYIANAGICSRREADQLIIEGLIKINGKVVTEMGVMVQQGDSVKYGGRLLNPEKPVYVLLNKPKDFITTTNDPQERNTVMNLVANACRERIYPVGRLDRNTTGLLLFTNDGELVEKLTHPSYKIKKIYQVELNRSISPEDAEAILNGLYFEEGKAVVDSMAVLDESRRVVGIEVHIGWNRIVRRIFEAKGYDVVKLDRVAYAGLTKKDLPRGHYRILTEKEIIMLKHFV